MKNEINLLPIKKQQSPADIKEIKLLRMLSIGMMLLVASLSIGVFFISALSPLETLKRQEDDALKKLDGMQTTAIKYLITQKRLGEIESLISARPNFPSAIDSMTKEQPQDITFSGIKIDNRNVTLLANSPSLLSINVLIQSLLQRSSSDKLYKNLVLSSIDYSLTKPGYSTELTVTLK